MNIPKKAYVLLTGAALCFLYSSLSDIIAQLFSWQIQETLYILSRIANPISITLLVISVLMILKATLNEKQAEVSKTNDIEQLRRRLFEGEQEKNKNKDILELMLTNMSEIKQYYSISKRHAQLSFILALLFCVFGFILLAYSFSLDKENTQPVIIGLIGGTVSELFAGTALLVHKSSLSQLNHYYRSLHENERFLSTVNLIDRLSKDKQDEAILKIIDSSLVDISSLIKKTDE